MFISLVPRSSNAGGPPESDDSRAGGPPDVGFAADESFSSGGGPELVADFGGIELDSRAGGPPDLVADFGGIELDSRAGGPLDLIRNF